MDTEETSSKDDSMSVASSVGSRSTDGTEIFAYTHEFAIKLMTEVILLYGLRLDFAERNRIPYDRPVTRKSVIEQVQKQYRNLKSELLSTLASLSHRISLACDVWRNEDRVDYVRVTAHWIGSDWCMHRRIINFKEVLDIPISDTVRKSIKAWGVKHKTFSVIVDEICDDDDTVEKLKNYVHPILDGRVFRVRCVCRTLSSCILEGLDLVTVELEKIRKGNYLPFNYRERYIDLCRKYGLEPRFYFPWIDLYSWDTTRDMLKRWMIYKDVIGEYLRTGSPELGFCEITEQDWVVISVYIRFLDVFYEAVDSLSRNYSPSSCGVLVHLVNIAKLFSEYRGSPMFEEKISGMEQKFLNHYDRIPYLFCLAAVMDPRIKLSGCHCLLESYYQCTNNTRVNMEEEKIALSNLLYEMFSQYESKFSRSEPSSSFSTTTGFAWSVIRQKKQKTTDSGFNELTFYLQTPHVFDKETEDNLDILAWWKTHGVIYPALASMARDLLTTPASTLDPEYAFVRNGERSITGKSRLLRWGLLKMYTCLSDWLHAQGRVQGIREPPLYDEDVDEGVDSDIDDDLMKKMILMYVD